MSIVTFLPFPSAHHQFLLLGLLKRVPLPVIGFNFLSGHGLSPWRLRSVLNPSAKTKTNYYLGITTRLWERITEEAGGEPLGATLSMTFVLDVLFSCTFPGLRYCSFSSSSSGEKEERAEVTLLRQSGSPLPGRRGWGTKNEDDCANRFETLQGDSQRNKMINLQKQRVVVGGEVVVQIGR